MHTEAAVYAALEGIARELTVVTVAHRLDTMKKSDWVVTLDARQVVDTDPPAVVVPRYQGVVAGLAPATPPARR